MALLARLFDFTPSTTIVSADVDSEFNQLVNILNGTSTTKDVLIKYSNATDPVLRVDQVSTGVIQRWLVNGTEKMSVQNNGSLRINSTASIADPVKLAINVDSNNNAGNLTTSIQTSGTSDKGMRIAMEGATSGGINAFEVTKFASSTVNAMLTIAASGRVATSCGYPTNLSDNPAVASGAPTVVLGGQYQQNVSTVGNVTSGLDDLHSYTIAGNVFANDGDCVQFFFSGEIANNANTKRLVLSFAGTTIYDSTTTSLFGTSGVRDWKISGELIRIDSDSVICVAQVTGGDAAIGTAANTTVGAALFSLLNTQVNSLTLTGTLNLKVQGESGASNSNDVTCNMSFIRKFAKGI